MSSTAIYSTVGKSYYNVSKDARDKFVGCCTSLYSRMDLQVSTRQNTVRLKTIRKHVFIICLLKIFLNFFFSLAHINSGQPYICHFRDPANTRISEICSDKNKGNKTGGKYAYTFPKIGSSYPGKNNTLLILHVLYICTIM